MIVTSTEHPTMLEAAAQRVASDLVEPQASDAQAVDIVTIITIILTVIQTIVEKCPQQSSSIVGAMRKPTRLQRAAVMKECRECCECCGNSATRRLAGRMADSIMKHAADPASLTDEGAAELIAEARGFDNLLI